MKTVSVLEAKTHLSALLEAVRQGEEVVITRRGQPVARLSAIAAPKVERTQGDLRGRPGWESFVYDPKVFTPMTEEEMRDEGWPV